MQWKLSSAIVFFGYLTCVPVPALAALRLYDNFNIGILDPDKWAGREGSLGKSAPNTEVSRAVVNGQLQLGLTSYGNTKTDSGTPGTSAVHLFITHPELVRTVRTKVIVARAKAEVLCPSQCKG